MPNSAPLVGSENEEPRKPPACPPYRRNRAHQVLRAVGAPEPVPASRPRGSARTAAARAHTSRQRSISAATRLRGFALEEQEAVTNLLYERLDERDVLAVQDRILAEDHPRTVYESAQTPAVRRYVLLTYGVWFELPAVLEKTGLSAEQPPDDIHAMARGPLAAAGGLYEADLIVDAFGAGDADGRCEQRT